MELVGLECFSLIKYHIQFGKKCLFENVLDPTPIEFSQKKKKKWLILHEFILKLNTSKRHEELSPLDEVPIYHLTEWLS